jgi:hypothetical protein
VKVPVTSASNVSDMPMPYITKCNVFVYADNDAGKVFWRRMGFAVRDDLRVVQRGVP